MASLLAIEAIQVNLLFARWILYIILIFNFKITVTKPKYTDL